MNVEKVWDARYILGARYLSKNTVTAQSLLHVLCFLDLRANMWVILQYIIRSYGYTYEHNINHTEDTSSFNKSNKESTVFFDR
jgi:hypothetical protein